MKLPFIDEIKRRRESQLLRVTNMMHWTHRGEMSEPYEFFTVIVFAVDSLENKSHKMLYVLLEKINLNTK